MQQLLSNIRALLNHSLLLTLLFCLVKDCTVNISPSDIAPQNNRPPKLTQPIELSAPPRSLPAKSPL